MAAHPSYRQVLTRIQKLNPAAEVLCTVSHVVQNPKSEIEDVEVLIRTDASLTSDIIRMSNSVYFGCVDKCSNLSEALKRVGMLQAQKVVNLSLAKSMYSKSLNHYHLSSQHVWAYGVSSAILLELIMRKVKGDIRNAYTVGTLHGVGKIVINTMLESIDKSLVWDKATPLVEWEKKHVGVSYAEASSDLLGIWKFPKEVSDAILEHTSPPANSNDLSAGLHLTVKLLEHIGPDLSGALNSIPEEVISESSPGIDEDDIFDLIEDAREHFAKICDSVGIEMEAS